METKAKQSNIRMPARKIRRVINTIRGKSVQDATNMLKFMPYFAARVVEKNLKCAVANASEKWGALQEELIVSEVYADEGPTYKRARPRAQGRVYRIHKRNSHLTIIVKVSEELKEKLKEKKKKTRKPKAKKQETKPGSETVETSATTEQTTETVEQEVVTETKEAEVLEEAKEELEQGITPEIETQPEIESPVESEAEKAETGKNIKVEKEQRESHTETAKKEEAEATSEEDNNKEEDK